jgi:methyl-accepting chemotaxis protein
MKDRQSAAERATPAASDIQEAKEILGEHYDNIEQKIEDIDQIAELQAKRASGAAASAY